MNISELIEALKCPEAFPVPTQSVEVRQTHISAVFLLDDLVYKVKKPLNLGFLDFSQLDRRRHFCEQEVFLNRRLAPDVYLGVVPIAKGPGGIRVEGDGEVVEWAVKMRRLPDSATLESRLARRIVEKQELKQVARRLAEFHAQAARSPEISAFGRFEVVAGNARENFEQSEPDVGQTVHFRTFERCRQRTEELLDELKPWIVSRAERHIPCDTHGDLHLDHVYLFDRPPPDDVVIVDCIEFNERFRYADPIADAAFLVMDLKAHRRDDLAAVFAASYLQLTRDDDGARLMPFYSAYRAIVRAKVEGIKRREAEIPESDKVRSLDRARRHWLLALRELECPSRRPALVLIGGLPGTGKSTLARHLSATDHFIVLRTDEIRKQLAGVRPLESQRTEFGVGIYSDEWTRRTYAEVQHRAEELLFQGQRVIVDATFGEDSLRQSFLEAADRWCVPVLWLECRADPEVSRQRLQKRRGDASDADWAVYQRLSDMWSPPTDQTRPFLRIVGTNGPSDHAVAQARRFLADLGVISSELPENVTHTDHTHEHSSFISDK
jgi:aminoglycoside phosphotransferase family enzyme/predicted kinase